MSLLSRAGEIIGKKKYSAEYEADLYYKSALENAGVCLIEKEYKKLMPQVCRCEALGIENQSLKDKFNAVIRRRKEIFAANGIDEKKFYPLYSCSECGDTGYVNGKPCICLKQAANNLITAQYGIDAMKFKSFEETDVETDPVLKAYLADTYAKMQKYCGSFPETKYKTHVFSGLSGTGKTYLASCISKKIIEMGYTVIFVTAFKLNEIFLKYHTSYKDGSETCLDYLYGCDLLVIDDLGTENTFKNVTNEYLLSILSERIIEEKHTLITTNLDGEQIRRKYDDRFHSRLLNKRGTFVFNFTGEDLRQLK